MRAELDLEQLAALTESDTSKLVQLPAWNPKKPITVDTIRKVLNEMGITVRLNLVSGRAEVVGLDERYSRGNACEILPTLVQDHIATAGARVSFDKVTRALGVIADEGRFHPVGDMLRLVPWDGVDRLPEVYAILGIADFDAVLVRKWLHQSVALALNDGDEPYGADGVLTLFGRQGCGKTSFLRKLACRSDWFLEGAAIDMSSKDTTIQAVSSWICELGEVDGMLRKEQSQLKGFLTNPFDVYRLPYARTAVRCPRRTSFAATVNDHGFLTDGTGSRRFWVVNINQINLRRLDMLDVPMLWRQIYMEYFLPDKQGFRLTPEERAQLETRNSSFDRAGEFEEEIQNLLDWSLPVNSWRWVKASDFPSRIDTSNVNASKIGRVLSKIATRDNRVETKHPGNVQWYWLPAKQSLGYGNTLQLP